MAQKKSAGKRKLLETPSPRTIIPAYSSEDGSTSPAVARQKIQKESLTVPAPPAKKRCERGSTSRAGRVLATETAEVIRSWVVEEEKEQACSWR
jgi:hypothetical protein